MDKHTLGSAYRWGAFAALSGAICMISGAVLWMASGTDLDRALITGEIANYLNSAAETRPLLVANLTLWIIGVLLMGVAGTMLANLSQRWQAVAQIAKLCYWTAVPLAIASFVAWLAIIVRIAPGTTPSHILLAETVGWFASRADWIATVLIVGAGPALVSLAGRGDWAPGWLVFWGMGAAFAGLLTIIAIFTGGLPTFGFLIVPVGLGWKIATGIVLLRRIPHLHGSEVA